MCFFYSIWKLYSCCTVGKEISVFNKINAVLLVLPCGLEALWMFANAKWATWNTFRYMLWQTGCKHHVWAKLALPCWLVNEYMDIILKKPQYSVFTSFPSIGESCTHRGQIMPLLHSTVCLILVLYKQDTLSQEVCAECKRSGYFSQSLPSLTFQNQCKEGKYLDPKLWVPSDLLFYKNGAQKWMCNGYSVVN